MFDFLCQQKKIYKSTKEPHYFAPAGEKLLQKNKKNEKNKNYFYEKKITYD